MPFWVKDSAYSWSPVKELWVKIASNGSGAWQLASEAWVKVSSTGASAWKKFYTNTSLKPYSTVPISIRTSSYTGTNVSGSYTYVGTKLWGNESVSPTNYWQNGPFTSTSYNWYYSKTSDGSGLLDGYTNIDTFDSTYYDGYYIYFQVKKTNSRGLSGTETSSPAYICLHVPTHGTNTFGLTTTAAQVGTPITFAYSWKNSSSYGIDTSRSTIEWYRGYPYADKRNLIESKTYSQLVATSYGSDYYGTYSYTPITADLNNNIYVVSTAYNSYTDYTSSPIVDTYSSDVIYTKPIINNPVTVNKDSGYQTYGYSLSSNTQTYTPTADTVYWGWQYASSNTATTGRSFYHYIPVVYIQVNDSGSESSEGVTHTFTLKDVIDSATGNSVSLIGKYLRFYSIGQKGGAQSDVNYSDWIGPIYDMVGSQGSPTIVWYQDGKATAYWPSATNAYYYWLEYSSDQSVWTRTGSIQYSAPTINSQANYTSLPLGVYYYRVVAYNADNVPSYSSAISFDSAPPKESFAFGDTLYIGTNGYISFNQGNSTSNITQTIGKVFGFYPGDLIADNISYASIHAEDGNDYFIIYWQGHRYSAITSYPLNEIKIEIWIPQPSSWYGSPVVFAYYSLSSITNNTIKDLNYPGYYYNGIKKSIGNSYAANGNDSQFYLDATSNTLILKSFSYKGSSWAGWIQLASNAYADDTYYTLTSFVPSAPSAPTNVTYDSVTQTSAVVRWNAPSNLGSTKFYQYEYSVNNGSWVGIGNQLFAYISNLTTGSTNNTVRIRGVNYSGLTSTSYGTATFDTLSGPSAFTTVSFVKSKPSSPGGSRSLSLSWNDSSNGPNYEVQYEGSNNNSTWTVLQSLIQSTYKTTTSDTYSASYYIYYRATIRARGSDYSLTNATYSDGGTSSSYVYIYATGSSPLDPTGLSNTTTSTSASITYTDTTSTGSNYLSGVQYKIDSGSWSSTNASSPISISNLSSGTTYTIYLRSINIDGYFSSGLASTSVTTTSNPGAFTTINGTKGFPSGATQSAVEPSGARSLSVSWNAATNGYRYEVQYEGSNNGTSWTVLQTFNASSYKSTTSDTYSASYYRYYRYSVRARGSDLVLANASYSDGGTSSSYVYRELTGTAPTTPTIGTVTKTYNTASIPFTMNSGGSNTINWNNYSTDNSTWSNIYASPLSLSSLSASTSYTYYFRSVNYDGLASGSTSTTFTTPAQPVSYTITYNVNGSGGTAPTSTTGNGTVNLASAISRTGYTFAGWFDASSGGTRLGSGGGSYNLTADITAYAHWARAGTVTLTTTDTTGAGGKFDFSNSTATEVDSSGITYYWTLGSSSSNKTLYNSLTSNTSGTVTTGRTTALYFEVYSKFTGTDGATYQSATVNSSVTFK